MKVLVSRWLKSANLLESMSLKCELHHHLKYFGVRTLAALSMLRAVAAADLEARGTEL
jgi:hypothetical protein